MFVLRNRGRKAAIRGQLSTGARPAGVPLWIRVLVACSAVVSALFSTGCGDETRFARRAVLEIQEVITFPAASEGVVLTETVRVSNGGDGELLVSSVEVNGPLGVFSQEGLDDLHLAPGEDTFVTITYAAQDSDRATGRIVIDSNGSTTVGTTLTEVRIETTEPLATLVVSPNPLDFGTVPAHTTATEPVSLLNLGNIEVTVTEVFALDPSGEFVVGEEFLDELPRTLTPNEEWIVEINYTPSNDNRDETPLQVEYRADGSNRPREEVVTMLANGESDAPCVRVSATDGYTFQPPEFGTTEVKRFAIDACTFPENREETVVTAIRLYPLTRGLESGFFELSDVPELPVVVDPADPVSFDVSFTPGSAGEQVEARIEIEINDGQEPSIAFPIVGMSGSAACLRADASCSLTTTLDSTPFVSDRLTVPLGSTVECTGSFIFSDDDLDVSPQWSLMAPARSNSLLTPTDDDIARFYVDATGTYTVSFEVVDGAGESVCPPSEVVVNTEAYDDLSIELVWNTPGDTDPFDTGSGAGADVDLHLIRVGEGCWNDLQNDCHWQSPTPDWGAAGDASDDPTLERNDTDGWGPESIGIPNPAPAIYRVGVAYQDDAGFGPTVARVRIRVQGLTVFERSRELADAGAFWEVADIEWPTGLTYPLEGSTSSIDTVPCPEL